MAAAVLVTVTLAACGGGSSTRNASGGSRTIDVDMQDIKYSMTTVSVKTGETVKFVFHNKGAVMHDAYIGDEGAQMAHEQQMSMSSGEHGGMGGTDGITVDPGKTGELTHTFDKAGTTIIGCHQPGHYQAGMKIDVTAT